MMLTDYVSRKEGARRLAIIEDSIDASIQWFEDFIQKHGERLIVAGAISLWNNDDDNTINKGRYALKQKMPSEREASSSK